MTVLLATALLKERLGWFQVLGIALSLIAIYLLNASGERELWSSWLPLAIVPVILWGVAGLLQKVSTHDISDRNSTIWFLAAFVLVGAIVMMGRPLPSAVPWHLWATTALLGFALAFGNYAITVAYACNGKASIITPLVGLYPLVCISAAVVLFGETFGPQELLGALLGVAGFAALTRKRKSETSVISQQ